MDKRRRLCVIGDDPKDEKRRSERSQLIGIFEYGATCFIFTFMRLGIKHSFNSLNEEQYKTITVARYESLSEISMISIL